MKILNAEQIKNHLDWKPLIACLEAIFRDGCEVPVRHHHTMKLSSQQDATMLLMPAWLPDQYAGVKIVNVFPDNGQKGVATIMGQYLLMDGTTGASLAIMDGAELTARRTAGASALAARFLHRKTSKNLFIVGSGRIASYLGLAHHSIRPLEEIRIWSRSQTNAEAAASTYREAGFNASAVASLEQGTRWADIISCATLSEEPLIQGEWLQPGTHVDLVGAFKPTMRETDTALVCKADVFVDTRGGALAEAGDLLIPIQEGKFTGNQVLADLAELTKGQHPGRTDDAQITLFKSVGAAQEDLAAAIACYESQLAFTK